MIINEIDFNFWISTLLEVDPSDKTIESYILTDLETHIIYISEYRLDIKWNMYKSNNKIKSIYIGTNNKNIFIEYNKGCISLKKEGKIMNIESKNILNYIESFLLIALSDDFRSKYIKRKILLDRLIN